MLRLREQWPVPLHGCNGFLELLVSRQLLDRTRRVQPAALRNRVYLWEPFAQGTKVFEQGLQRLPFLYRKRLLRVVDDARHNLLVRGIQGEAAGEHLQRAVGVPLVEQRLRPMTK